MFVISGFFSIHSYLDSGLLGLIMVWACSSAPTFWLPNLTFNFTNTQFILIYSALILALLFTQLHIANVYILMLPLANFWVNYFKN